MDGYGDYAANDPRSVKAWLAGRDDGRTLKYETFCKKALRENPALSDLDLGDMNRASVKTELSIKRKARVFALTFAVGMYALFATWYLVWA